MQPENPPMTPVQIANPAAVTPVERKRSLVVYYEHLINEVPAMIEWNDKHVRLYYLDKTTGALGELIFDAPVAELSHIRLALSQLRMSYQGREYVLDFDRAKTSRMQISGLSLVSPLFLIAATTGLPLSEPAAEADLAWWVATLQSNGVIVKKFNMMKFVLIGLGVLVLLFVAWVLVSFVQEFIKNGP